MKKYQRVSLWLLAALLAVSVIACSPSTPAQQGAQDQQTNQGDQEQSAQSTEPVTLTMYTYNGSSTESLNFYKGLISKLENENPGASIDLILTEDPTGLSTQQLAAGGGPDILTVEPTSIQLFADAGYLAPLDDYAKQFGWDVLFSDWATETTSRDGKLMGLPGAIDGLVMYYNKTLFSENGWSVPTNYQDFMNLCETMKSKDILPITFGSSDFKMANQWWLSMAYSSALGQEKFHSLLQGDLRWDSDEVRGATQKLIDMWSKGYIYENSAGITLDDARNLFTNGQAAMTMSGQWDVEMIIEADPAFEWGAFQMPAWGDGFNAALPVAVGETFSINSKCKNIDLAAKFLNMFYEEDAVTKRLGLGVLYPTNNSNAEALTEMDHHFVEVYDLMLDAMEQGNIGYCAWTYWPPNTDTYAWNNLESLYLGQLSLDEYLKNLQSNYEEDVARNNILSF